MESWREELYSDSLYHHGIKGMKWGVRRYQNSDGTLTAAGRRRYDISSAKSRYQDTRNTALSKYGEATDNPMSRKDAKAADAEYRNTIKDAKLQKKYDIAKAKEDAKRAKNPRKYEKSDAAADDILKEIDRETRNIDDAFKAMDKDLRQRYYVGSKGYAKNKAFQDAYKDMTVKAARMAKVGLEAKKHPELKYTKEYQQAHKDFGRTYSAYIITGGGNLRYSQLKKMGRSSGSAAAQATVETILGFGVNWQTMRNLSKVGRSAGK